MRKTWAFAAGLVASLAVPGRALATEACLRPSAAAAAHEGTALDTLLVLGRADFAAGRFDDAGARLRDVALKHPDFTTALDATNLYLESLNVLGSKQSRLACFDDMEADVPVLRARYCDEASAKREDATCVLLDKIQVDILRLRAQKLVEAADKDIGGATAIALYEQGGTLYLETFREHCQVPSNLGRQPHPNLSGCIEMVYNAGRAFRAARLSAKSLGAFRGLVAFDQQTKAHSPLAEKASYEIGASYHAMAVYDLAAEWYERYATRNPKAFDADRALSDAVILRLGLSQETEALADAAIFMKNWGVTKRPQSAALALAIAAHHAEHGAWDKMHSVLTGAMESLERGPLDLTIRAHLLLAQGHVAAHEPDRAAAEYAKVRDFWRDPAATEARIRATAPDEADYQRDRRVARALNAVGEATFAAAESRRLAEVEPLKLPRYTGPADSASILAHVNTKVKPWYEKKRAAIAQVEADYLKLLELKPVPPPIWVIAAGSATGMMWGEFADEFRRVPIPDAWRKNRVLFHAYYDAVDDMSESIRSRFAKPAIKKCVDLAAKYQISDARARSCETWLATNYKSEYHVVDELIPAFRAGLPQRYDTPPFTYEGALYRPRTPQTF